VEPKLFDRLRAAGTVKELARREGFPICVIAPAGPPSRFDRFGRFLAEGRHAGMNYLARSSDLRSDARNLLPGARSVLCVARPHSGEAYRALDGTQIARYAHGQDYHRSLKAALERLASAIAGQIAPEARFRICVDSAPILERDFAAAAGLGWIGKNGCLIEKNEGSYLLLGEIVTDLDLPPDDPAAEACGACVACLEACPTGAFVEPGFLDAGRCLSYWTIEHRGVIPDAIKEQIGDRVFGCDICQEVCPWNQTVLSRAGPPEQGAGLHELLTAGPGLWRRRYAPTALARAGRAGLRRNAAISAGVRRRKDLLPVLSPLARSGNIGVRDAARWAIAKISSAPMPEAPGAGIESPP
jgi:epoxyqueuosine reductase